VHPDAERAAEGFAAQGGPGSRYSDDKQKDEILVALSEFDCFAGWRHAAEGAGTLAALGYPEAAVQAALDGDLVAATREVLRGLPGQRPWDPTGVADAMGGVPHVHATAVAEVASLYPDDPGVGVAALLQYRRLLPGEALYVPAGVPHAYVQGFGLEVMTSSDNVLRLGLTPKEVAIEDALAAIRLDRAPVVFTEPGVKWADGAPFRVLVERGVQAELETGRYRVVVAIDGEVQLRCGSAEFELAAGQAFLAPAADPTCAVSTSAMVGLVESVEAVRD
jgi:mannose-6-phosphate isomerase